MFKYEETVEVNHSIDKVYNLVASVEKYPEFIPWCNKVELLKVDEQGYHYYKLLVKFGMFSQEFTTKDKFWINEKVEIDLEEGPFKRLYSIWRFKELFPGKTKVDFYIDFEFKSTLLTKLLGKVFLEANKKILKSFLSQLDK